MQDEPSNHDIEAARAKVRISGGKIEIDAPLDPQQKIALRDSIVDLIARRVIQQIKDESASHAEPKPTETPPDVDDADHLSSDQEQP